MKAPGRIEETFARLKSEGRTGFVAFLTVGYPDVESTLRLVPALIAGGADIIELGVPFSDPLAEGADDPGVLLPRAATGRDDYDVPGGGAQTSRPRGEGAFDSDGLLQPDPGLRHRRVRA